MYAANIGHSCCGVPANILSVCLLIVFSFGEEKLLLYFKPEHCFFLPFSLPSLSFLLIKLPIARCILNFQELENFCTLKKELR